MNGKIVLNHSQEGLKEAKVDKTDLSQTRTSRSEQAMKEAAESAGRSQPQKVETFKRVEKKVGRNEPCPCGSGKKFKHCHG